MSKTVRVNPLLIFIAVLIGASLGSLIGGLFGSFVAALLAIPTAGALQVLAREIWQATAPDQPQESPAPAACSHHHPGTAGFVAGVRRKG